jgi:hypothetical protein
MAVSTKRKTVSRKSPAKKTSSKKVVSKKVSSKKPSSKVADMPLAKKKMLIAKILAGLVGTAGLVGAGVAERKFRAQRPEVGPMAESDKRERSRFEFYKSLLRRSPKQSKTASEEFSQGDDRGF